MKVLVFGGSGFIGRHLIPVLIKQGYVVVLFSRNPGKVNFANNQLITTVKWDAVSVEPIMNHCLGSYVIINLAGESIAAKPWTKTQKNLILSSRLSITRLISIVVQKASEKPQIIFQGSAVGYYGSRADLSINEQTPRGNGFLAEVVDAWEKSIEIAEPEKTRLIFLRTGVVLGSDGGILPKLLLPFKFFAGGYPGDGRQWFPWIHIRDVTAAISFLLKMKNSQGVYNLTSPEPVKMKQFCTMMAKVLGRPSWLSIPQAFIKLLPGGMAEDLFLTSQKVLPSQLTGAGYMFDFPACKDALADLLKKK